MQYSHYQEAIFNWVKTGMGHLRVDALAGSGKSTTAKHALMHMPPMAKVGLTAFNKLIADALAPEVKKYHANATAFTLHSFGYATLRKNFRKLVVNKYKNNQILESVYFDLRDPKQKSRYYFQRNAINRLVSLLKLNLQIEPPTVDRVLELASEYGIDLPGDDAKIAEIAADTFVISRDTARTHAEIDFDDMVYGPLFYKIRPETFDFLIIDEFQDFNAAQLELVLQAGATGRMITFGDRNQSIYNFAGAKVGIMDNFVERMGAARLPLSICYRCPVAVIQEARKYVPEIESAPDAPMGAVRTIQTGTFETYVHPKDAVLCRFTAPLVSWCLKFISKGIKAYVKGKDIGQNLAALIDRIDAKIDGPTLNSKLESYRFQEMARLTELGREDEADTLNDKIDAIIAIGDGTDGSARALKARIDEIFQDEAGVGIAFMTIHKAKGLEFSTVYILDPGKKARARTEAQKQEERNLQYVAVTRSMQELFYVKG